MNHIKKLSEELHALLIDKPSYKPKDFQRATVLLEAGANPNIRENEYEVPMDEQITRWDNQQRFEMVKLLIKYGADVNQKIDIYDYPIEQATLESKGDLKYIEYLLKKGAVKGLEGALKNAIELDFIEIAELLIAQGVDVRLYKPINVSYLNFCADTYRRLDKNIKPKKLPGLKMAQMLIDKGADPSGVEYEVEYETMPSPLAKALQEDYVELAELVLINGAKTEKIIEIKEREDSVFNLVKSVRMAKLLLQYGANLNGTGEYKCTALIISVTNKRKKLISFLINQGIDLYLADIQKFTAFHHGILMGDLKYIKYLLPYFDVKKCHAIKSVLNVSDDPKVNDFLRKKL